MITAETAILLVAFGEVSALLLIIAGTILHMRWIDRKLNKPLPKTTQKPPTTGGTAI